MPLLVTTLDQEIGRCLAYGIIVPVDTDTDI